MTQNNSVPLKEYIDGRIKKKKAVSMTDCDTFPNCPAAQVAIDQTRNNKEVSDKLDSIADHQKTFGESITAMGFQLADIKFLTGQLRELKEDNKKEHDEFFTRMRLVESSKAERTDIVRLESDRIDWKTKIIFAGVTVMLSVFMFLVGYFTK